MSDSAHPTPNRPLSRLSLFWQLQLAGWTGFSLFTLPLKQAFSGSLQASVVMTALQLPLALACSTGIRWFFHQAKADRQNFPRTAVFVLKYRFNLSQDSFQVRATLCLPLTA